MQKLKVQGLAIVTCILITIMFVFVFHRTAVRTGELDMSEIQIIKQAPQVEFYVNNIEKKGDRVCITAGARNDNIIYEYVNQVLGAGTGVYRKVSVILVDEEKNIGYKLRTYPYRFNAEDESKISLCNNNGVIAYGTHIDNEKDLKVGVLFEDREGKKYALYED